MMKNTYIEKAQAIYESIIEYKTDTHKFFILQTLNDYGVEYVLQLEILKNVLGSQEAPILQFSVDDDGSYRFSFKDSYDFTSENGKDIDEKNHCFYADLRKDGRYKEDMTDISGQYSIIAALVIWEKTIGTKQEEAKGEKIAFDNNEELASLLKRSFGKFCAAYTHRYSKTDFYDFCAAQTLLFFAYLWKSVAVGEFYIVPNFKDIIKPNKDKEADNLDAKLLPAFVGYYSDIASAVSTFFNRVDPRHNDSYELHFDLDQEFAIDSVSAKHAKIEQLKFLMGLTQKLFDITVIDIRYFASEDNLHKLVNFIDGFYRFKNNLSTTELTPNQRTSLFLANKQIFGFDALSFLKRTMESLVYKACVMWEQILNQPSPDRELRVAYNSLANASIDSTIHHYCLFATDYGNDFFYTSFLFQKNKEVKDDNINRPFYGGLTNCRLENKRYQDQSFIREYNNHIDEYISFYMKASKMYSLINEDKDSENIINAIRTFVRECDDMTKLKSASPSAFVKSVLWMSRHLLGKGKERDHQEILLYGKLLNCLRLFTILYANGKGTPHRYRSYFEYSFCKVDAEKGLATMVHLEADKFRNYNASYTEDCIFFASQGYNPVNMRFLENFFLKYNWEFRTFESDAIDASIEVSKESSQKAQQMVKTMSEERSRTLQLVGLLGTFIAFVSSLVGVQKVAANIFDFMLFLSTFMTGVLVFVLCVHHIAKSIGTPSGEEKGNKSYGNIIVLISLILLTVFLACIRSCNADTGVKEETESSAAVKHGTPDVGADTAATATDTLHLAK
jgi:hypothetical protein